MTPTTSASFYHEIHGDSEFLSKESIIDFAHRYHTRKLQEIYLPNDTYSEKRKPYPPPLTNTPIQDIP